MGMDFSIQSQFQTQSVTPQANNGKASANVIDMDPAKIVEDFAKMLVAQISNQDPDQAMDATAIITQYSQMTASLGVARLTNHYAFYEQVRLASSSVGKVIAYQDAGDPTNVRTGVVTEADFTGPNPNLIINGTDTVPVLNLVKIFS